MKIGELARQARVSIDAVRFYEQRGLLPRPARSSSGYRQYVSDDVRRLRFIVHAKDLGFTLEEIRQLLALRADSSDCARVREVAAEKANEIGSRIEKLSGMRDVLLKLARQCERGDSSNACPILESLEKGNE
ncbi:MAG: heavy metal-responsive transcriptional regulator [Mariprofundaceae bacterium]|nr:heavy metal-responsive transcriptional regulator [Mariprofundaceae bacterium]